MDGLLVRGSTKQGATLCHRSPGGVDSGPPHAPSPLTGQTAELFVQAGLPLAARAPKRGRRPLSNFVLAPPGIKHKKAHRNGALFCASLREGYGTS